MGHADKVHNETLYEFRSIKKDIKIIEWNVDNYLLDNTEKKFKQRSHLIDAFFITNADKIISSCLCNNNSISFFPNIFDSSIERLRIFEISSFKYDLFYALSYGVGSGKIRSYKSDYDREVFLDHIKKNFSKIKTNFFGYKGNQPVWGADFEREISKSPISLNLSRKPHLKYYSSDRISQYLGNGSCLFVDRNSKNHSEAKRIAKKGWDRGHKDYNERIVTSYFLDIAFNNKPTKDYSWPVHQFYK